MPHTDLCHLIATLFSSTQLSLTAWEKQSLWEEQADDLVSAAQFTTCLWQFPGVGFPGLLW